MGEAFTIFERKSAVGDDLALAGRYNVTCLGPDGEIKWRDRIDNVVTTAGKNVALNAALAGSSYSVAGLYMGLISSASYAAGPLRPVPMHPPIPRRARPAPRRKSFRSTQPTALMGGAHSLQPADLIQGVASSHIVRWRSGRRPAGARAEKLVDVELGGALTLCVATPDAARRSPCGS
jgi:hypothetical protein